MNQIITPTKYNCAEELFNSLYLICENTVYLNETVSPKIIYIFNELSPFKLKFIYFKENPICPNCGSKLNKNGTKKYNLNKNQEYYKQQYSCSSTKCKYTTTASLEQHIEKSCNYTKEIRQKGLELEYIEHISHEKKAEIIQKEIGTKIPRQTIQYHEFEKSEQFIEKEEKTIQKEIKKRNITSSGIIHYDEEFFTKNKEKYVRLTLLDSKTRLILNDQIILQNQFDIDFIEIFLKYSLENQKRKILITDGHTAYPEIIQKLNLKQQKCTFHKIQIQRTPVWKKIHRLERQNKSKQKQINKNLEKINTINKKHGKIKKRCTSTEKTRRKNLQKRKKLQRENQKLKKQIRDNKKEIKEYENYNKRISDLFKSKTVKQARRKFKTLQGEIKSMPEEIQKFIKSLSKDFETTINHIKNPEIPSTNNLIEGYYKTTFPGKIKRIFRTDKGLKTRLKLSQLRWTKRNVLKIK